MGILFHFLGKEVGDFVKISPTFGYGEVLVFKYKLIIVRTYNNIENMAFKMLSYIEII